jgi:hypothetical protein
MSKPVYLFVLIGLLANFTALLTISSESVPNAFAFDTHMTLHNLQNQIGDEGPAELSIIGASSCTAQANSNCEAGADYVWYTIDVCVTTCGNGALWQSTMHGIYGSCDVYVQLINGTVPPKFQASHHCTAAEKANLKPPSENQSAKEPSCGIQCNAGKINP